VKGYKEYDASGNCYVVPQSYEEWMTDVVDKFDDSKVTDAIKGNHKLLNYIRGLIGVCRANPNIINHNNPTIIAKDTTPDYIKNLNMKKYKIPSVALKSRLEFFAESLRNALQPNVITQDLFNPITSGSFSNVQFFNPYTSRVPAMMGGNPFGIITPSLISSGTGIDTMYGRQAEIVKHGSASMFKNLFSTISNAFADVGIRLHPTDENTIGAVIKKLERYEDNLARLFSVLITVVKIARFYGITIEHIDREHPKILKLSNINTIDDVREWVIGYVKELTRGLVTNMSIQQAAAFELTHKVAPRLLDDACGKTTTGTSSAAAPKREYVKI